jgi:hypothetical protein
MLAASEIIFNRPLVPEVPELRAALSLTKLYQPTNRAADAHAVLPPALEGFSPTPESPEIEEAQTPRKKPRLSCARCWQKPSAIRRQRISDCNRPRE